MIVSSGLFWLIHQLGPGSMVGPDQIDIAVFRPEHRTIGQGAGKEDIRVYAAADGWIMMGAGDVVFIQGMI